MWVARHCPFSYNLNLHYSLGENDLWRIRISTIPISLKQIPNLVTSLTIRSGLLLHLGKSHLISYQQLFMFHSFFRKECALAGVHPANFAGIAGSQNGAYSICLSGGYEDDKDDGETLYINWNIHLLRVLTACFIIQCLYRYRWSLFDSHRVSLTDSCSVRFLGGQQDSFSVSHC